MEFRNPIKETVVQIDEAKVKDVIQTCLIISSKGTKWYSMPALETESDRFYIVNEDYLFNTTETQEGIDRLKIRIKSLENQLHEIAKVTSKYIKI